MGVKCLVPLLLCAAALTLSGVFAGDSGTHRWDRQRIPLLLDKHTQLLNRPLFTGREEDEGKGNVKTLEGQFIPPRMSKTEQETILGYETMYDNGTRTHTDVSLQDFNATVAGEAAHSQNHTRRKRQVYGSDGRFVIADSHFVANYPFSTAVRLSSGCSGVLVSTKHVLTAAHCIHDGSNYLTSARRLRVGVLQLKGKRGKGGRRRRGRRQRGARRENGKTGEESVDQVVDDDGEQHNVAGDVGRGRKGGQRRRGRRGEKGGGQKILIRSRRSSESTKEPVFRWTRVKQTQIPQGWIHTENSNDNAITSDYDYALLELRRPVHQKYMRLGVAPSAAPVSLIHFSSYDADKSLLDGRGDVKVVYRFCSVVTESDNLMYQQCDASPGATGAGVYVRLRQEAEDAGGNGKWQRRVIGVYSGHQWVEGEGGELEDFNVAVRITPHKYAQICHWIHGDPSLCEEV